MKIRTRIVLVFVVVVAGGFYFLVQWIADDLRPRYLESLEEPLVDTAHLLAELLAAGTPGKDTLVDGEHLGEVFERLYQRRFQARIYALEKQHVDLRIYVTDATGRVVFDSTGRDVGADYSRWNDVYRTLRGRYGARSSNEDPEFPERSVLYIAAPILGGDGTLRGVVSVGKPASNADRFLAMATRKLTVAGLVATLAVLALGLVLYAWVSRPLGKLIRYAQAVKAGERVSLPRLGNNEIGMMGAAMEEMRRELAGRDYAERYVQTLTHELKSPLAAIHGAAELLEEHMPLAQRRRFLANIRTETRRVQDLVERLLELAALEKRQALDNPRMVSLDALLDDVRGSLAPLATRRGITLDFPEGHCTVHGEGFLLRQAIQNLLQNAIDFSPAGATVRVSLLQDPHWITLGVEDQGPGVPDYALARVFERFYSLPRPEQGRRGSGLGLSLVQEVAQLHGGEAGLANRAEGGAHAWLRLPRESFQFRTARVRGRR